MASVKDDVAEMQSIVLDVDDEGESLNLSVAVQIHGFGSLTTFLSSRPKTGERVPNQRRWSISPENDVC